MPRALIIEDNAHARADLEDRLQAHPDVIVVGHAASVDDARALLTSADYDLVFLDIQLIGGEAFELIPSIRLDARIIFTTAFDDYAVRAFEVNALDYLIKPIQPKRLALALAKLPSDGADATDFPGALRAEDVVYLRNTTGAQVVPLANITAIVAAQNYTEVNLIEGRPTLVRRTLASWEAALPGEAFVRVARDALVNLRCVERHERTGDKGAALFVRGRAEPIPASHRHWPEVRPKLEKLWG